MQSINSLQPLADFLEPQFGNIYKYNLQNRGGFDVQPWTEELKAAVKDYLLHKTPAELQTRLNARFFHFTGPVKEVGPTEEQADAIIASHEVRDIATALRKAAIEATPTLADLIERTDSWGTEEQREAIKLWFMEHVPPWKLLLITQRAKASSAKIPYDLYMEYEADTLTREVSPKNLLAELQELDSLSAT